MNNRYYIKKAMNKRAFPLKKQSEVISNLMTSKVKETLLVHWAKKFAKKTGISNLLGSGVYEFLSQAWKNFESKSDGSIDLNFSGMLDFLEKEGFREPKTEFGKKFGPALQRLTSVSDFAQYVIKILVCDGTDELREVTGIPFTKLTKQELSRGKGIDISNVIPGSESFKEFLGTTIVDMDERKLALITYMIPLFLGLMATQIALPSFLALIATDLTGLSWKIEIAKFFAILFFGSSAKRSSVIKKIWIMAGGGFFALLNDLYSLVGWTTKNIILFILKSVDKYSQWSIIAVTSGVSEANKYIQLKNEKERELKEKLELQEKNEREKKQLKLLTDLKRKRIKSIEKEKVLLNKRLVEIEKELNPQMVGAV